MVALVEWYNYILHTAAAANQPHTHIPKLCLAIHNHVCMQVEVVCVFVYKIPHAAC